MKCLVAALVLIGALSVNNYVQAATMTCQVTSIDGGTVVLEECDPKRASDFKPGDKVKVKIQTKSIEKQ